MSDDGKGEAMLADLNVKFDAVAVGLVPKIVERGSSGDVTMILLETIRAGLTARVKTVEKDWQTTLGSKCWLV